jgi:hypothetical protein
MSTPLTPQQKSDKRARDNLKILHASVMSAWCFKQLHTWRDLYLKLGYTEEWMRDKTHPWLEDARDPDWPLTLEDVQKLLKRQTDELENKLKGATNGKETKVQEVTDGVHTSTTPKTIQTIEVKPEKEQVSDTPIARISEPSLTSDNDYGWKASPNAKAFLYWFQKKASVELCDKIFNKRYSGVLLLSGTGTGKTFIIGDVCRKMWDREWHEGKTVSHMPYLYVTRTTVVEQACRVFKNFFNVDPVNDVEIINIEQLRSQAGQFWVREDVKILPNGEEESFWKWKQHINPCVIFFDESQAAKNSISTQHKIMCAYNDLPKNACLISVSATPFTRVSEAKCFAVSTHRPLDHLPGFPKGAVLNNENWPTYAKIIAAPASPEDYNQAAIERLMKDLDDYVVRVRGVRPQFEADNGVDTIDFETDEKRTFYETAWERFLAEKAKIEAQQLAGGGVASGNNILVALLKFAMAAEFCHAEGFAKDMHHAVQEGFAACAAVKFKGTIIEIVRILTEKFGVPRDKISLVWGGGQTQLTKKQIAKKMLKAKKKEFEAMGMTVEEMMETLDLDEVEDRELLNIPAHMRLGLQDMDERQREIDKFQRGDSLYCCYTFKAGGVGLSLHHTDELTKFKCRRKPSGYAYEEDIPKVPVRPRTTFVALTYNAIELVQGVGRVPRLTSLSPTRQRVKCYRGTVEVDIGRIVSQKLRCLSSVVKQHEDWQSIIMGAGSDSQRRGELVRDALATTEGIEPDESSSMIDEGEDDE